MREGFGAFDELWLSISCVHPTTKIITHNSIVKANSNVLFKNPLLSLDFEKREITPSESIAQVKRFVNPKEKLIYISTRTREIITSPDHVFFVFRRDPNFWGRHKKIKEEEIKKFISEKKAKDLRKGDRVIIASKIPEPKAELISPRQARLLGYILADGHIAFPDTYKITLADKSKECLENYEKVAKSLGFSTSWYKHEEADCWILNVYDPVKKMRDTKGRFTKGVGGDLIKNLVNLVKDVAVIGNGQNPSTLLTDIPEVIIKSNNRVVSEFLGGFIDGEGCVQVVKLKRRYLRITITNTKRNIIEKIKYLLLRFGIESSKVKTRKHGRDNPIYNIYIRDNLSIKRFKENIKLLHPEKQSKIDSYKFEKEGKQFNGSKRRIFGDIEIGFITEKREIEPDTPYLVDLSVPYYQNYIANGFIVHNSWSRSKQIEFITSILLKSRKRGLTICYTTQSISQINKRIREVTDFLAYCLLSVDNSYARVEIFRGPKPSIGTRMKPPIYFNVEPVIAMFNTYEEVKPLIPKEDAEKLNLPVAEEVFIPITQNPAWIRYLRSKGIRTKDRILKYSQKIMKVINPEGITSEDQREHEDFEVV